ncbi:hypothetical protein BN129_92 [Cronobacter sakazakii 701]|nr:hypothetical protein BN129_92 [Cronobacter sakazakii 701]
MAARHTPDALMLDFVRLSSPAMQHTADTLRLSNGWTRSLLVMLNRYRQIFPVFA